LKLTSLNIYFSLCLSRSEELCTVIPLQRLILETDAPHQNNVFLLKEQGLFEGEVSPEVQKQNEKKNRVDYVRANIGPLCGYYNLDRNAFSHAVFENTLRVFRLLK
jgi:Tat protein secretion system quality control protein TatD with DNase activity